MSFAFTALAPFFFAFALASRAARLSAFWASRSAFAFALASALALALASTFAAASAFAAAFASAARKEGGISQLDAPVALQ